MAAPSIWFGDHHESRRSGGVVSLVGVGPLVSRDRLERGELQRIIRELALREYAIPGSRRCLISEKTIED